MNKFTKFRLLPILVISCSCLTSCATEAGSNAKVVNKNNDQSPSSYLSRPSSYRLAWSDEFNSGSALDNNKWRYDIGSRLLGDTVWGNKERQYYTSNANNVHISKGNLVIKAKHEIHPLAPKGYGVIATSSRPKTESTNYYDAIGTQPYGYYEIRAKITCVAGSWPAIWFLGKSGEWPDRGEIDVLEWFGKYFQGQDKTYSGVHTKDNHGGNNLGADKIYPGLCSEFKTHQMHWAENYIAIGVDGVLTYKYDKPVNANNNNWPFDQPAYLIFNIAVGGNLGGDVNTADINSMRMDVDYVRIWQK